MIDSAQRSAPAGAAGHSGPDIAIETAEASRNFLSPKLRAQVAELERQATRLCDLGAHERAEPLLEQALSIVVSALGSGDIRIAGHLDRLAQCRLNGGRLEAALANYRMLLALSALNLERARPLSHGASEAVNHCIQELRVRSATARLQVQLMPMLRQARSQRAVCETQHQERIRTLARRLIARGRVSTGAQLLEHWLGLLVRAAHPIDAESIADIRDHALALWNCGEIDRACRVLGALVQIHQQRPRNMSGLRQALSDWGACLAAQGQRRSAVETVALAASIGFA